jgi:hypothetical protein
MAKLNGLGRCLIEHCPNERRVLSPLCHACAQSFSYWDKRGPAAILHRQNQLEKWQDRMIYLGTEHTDNRRLRNVARKISRRRA